MSAALALHRLVAIRVHQAASSSRTSLPRTLAGVPGCADCHRYLSGHASGRLASSCRNVLSAAAWRQPQRLLSLGVTCQSYSVVIGGSDGDAGGGNTQEQQPWRLIVYSKEGCYLCDGLKDKLEALLDRAPFMPSAFSYAQLEVRDITCQPEWQQRYAMSIPVLAAAAADGSGEMEVPRPSPRLTADALQKHIEKFLAEQPQLLGGK